MIDHIAPQQGVSGEEQLEWAFFNDEDDFFHWHLPWANVNSWSCMLYGLGTRWGTCSSKADSPISIYQIPFHALKPRWILTTRRIWPLWNSQFEIWPYPCLEPCFPRNLFLKTPCLSNRLKIRGASDEWLHIIEPILPSTEVYIFAFVLRKIFWTFLVGHRSPPPTSSTTISQSRDTDSFGTARTSFGNDQIYTGSWSD